MEGYDQVRYMVGLVDLLATCAEVSYVFLVCTYGLSSFQYRYMLSWMEQIG